MKLLDIMNARQVISEIANQATNVKLAYKFAKFMSVTQSDYEFYSKTYIDTIAKYDGKPTTEGITFDNNKAELFNADMMQVQQTEAVDPHIRFDLNEFTDNMKLSTQQIYLLLPFVRDEEQDN